MAMRSELTPAKGFVIAGLLSLWCGALFGVIGSWQHVVPNVVDAIPFVKSRPLHVSLVIAWIFLTAVGGVYHYLPRIVGAPLHSTRLAWLHLAVFIGTGIAVIASYFMGRFGGREYWEFPPVLGIPIALSWGLLIYNFFRTANKHKGPWPAYLWMWATGIVFFLITYAEANLYLFPHFTGNMVREITVQWKAYGALTGSWNMLVYGTAMVVMERSTGNMAIARSKTAYLLFGLGFTNLLFGWAHHIYPVPSALWIRMLAYAISMTEWIILARMIHQWRTTVEDGKRGSSTLFGRFLFAGEVWVFLNLGVALLISIPAINLFAHGTHIVVAHAMGSTIGINTTILFASVFFIAGRAPSGSMRAGFWIFNGSLLAFWICLIGAGLVKGWFTVMSDLPFQTITEKIWPYIAGFAVSGIGLFTGLSMLVWGALKVLLASNSKEVVYGHKAYGLDAVPVEDGRPSVPEKPMLHRR
ncbi:MAG: cbb3-type cytochrome c oxidase subunit I [Flavobacteriales bacterium]|jgi:nitric oxide reductase subunit B|nr:cbb3-type cytochrome c oxidase subunit I [Flavobacteriales bacterium]MBK6892908.1 cbb3-type cytochrome c oxidase subunit I [Flavobacteriales bacterium]MBK9061343.1 cbb3-type cytochrome c oxidase subunit I [Flavobacteriales bacterium]MBK9596787.1 cbb3-type cytochrome c oxidase subunit I [Flavobacteriales bacterium]QQS72709.1 MAG: cbb3-type cytochrome c oxidase subunit I [Flavobacteriales bacterium]